MGAIHSEVKTEFPTTNGLRRQPANFRCDLLVYVLTAGVFLFQSFVYLRIEDYGHDASCYIGLAESIQARHAYDFSYKPNYPPGLPLILAATFSTVGETQKHLMRLMTTCGFLGIIAAYRLLRLRVGCWVAAGCTLLLMLSPYYFNVATRLVGSDLPYFLFSMLALLAQTKLVREETSQLQAAAFATLFTLSALASLAVRSVGIALVAAAPIFILSDFLKRATRPLRILSLFLPVIFCGLFAQVAWDKYVKAHYYPEWPTQANFTYSGQLMMKSPRRPELGRAAPVDYLDRSYKNLVIHSAHLSELATYLPWVDPKWYSPFVLLPLCLLSLGLFAFIKSEGLTYTEIYFGLYAAIYLLWPFDVGARFMLPVAPLAFMYMSCGAKELLPVIRANWRRFTWLMSTIPLAVLILAVVQTFVDHNSLSLQSRLALLFWVAVSMVGSLMSLLRWYFPSKRWTWHFDRVVMKKAASGLAILVLGFGLVHEVSAAHENLAPEPSRFYHAPSVQAARWLRSHGEPSDGVMAEQTAIVHRVSGMRVVGFPPTRDAELIWQVLKDHRIRFLVVTDTGNVMPSERDRLEKMMRTYPGVLSKLESGYKYEIFAVGTTRNRQVN